MALDRWLQAGRETIERFSAGQRLTLAGVTIAAVTGLVWFTVANSSPEFRELPVNPDARHNASRLLQKSGVECRSGAGGVLEVRAGRVIAARQILAEAKLLATAGAESVGGSLESRPEPAAAKSERRPWLFQPLDTPDGVRQRVRDRLRQHVENAIGWQPKIRRAHVMMVGDSGRSVLRRTQPASATVALLLEPGVTRLTAAEARAVRIMVGGTFNLPEDAIRIADNRGQAYDITGVTGGAYQNDTQQKIYGDIRSAFSNSFADEEFTVIVNVAHSARRSLVETVTHGPEAIDSQSDASTGGLLSRQEASIREKTEVPPGEIQGISVTVVIDQLAALRLLSPQPSSAGDTAPRVTAELHDRLNRFVADQEAMVRNIVQAWKVDSVKIVVQPFAKRPAVARSVDPSNVAEVHPVPDSHVSERTPAQTRDARLAWAFVVSGAALAFVLVLVFLKRPATRRVSGSGAATGIPRRQPGREPEVMGSAADLSQRVRERPRSAASILRLWLAEDAEPTSEGRLN